MPSLADVVIETERLRLLPTSEAYAEVIFREFTPAVTTYMFPRPAQVIEETLAFLREARAKLEAGIDLQVVILLKETGEFIGHAGLHGLQGGPHGLGRTPELGIWTKVSAHGHGYGREAVTALSYWALDNHDFDYLIYPVDRRNVASRRIPESLGGVIEREYEQMNLSGDMLELVEYRIYPEALRGQGPHP